MQQNRLVIEKLYQRSTVEYLNSSSKISEAVVHVPRTAHSTRRYDRLCVSGVLIDIKGFVVSSARAAIPPFRTLCKALWSSIREVSWPRIGAVVHFQCTARSLEKHEVYRSPS